MWTEAFQNNEAEQKYYLYKGKLLMYKQGQNKAG
jgi:hypothetical protein